MEMFCSVWMSQNPSYISTNESNQHKKQHRHIWQHPTRTAQHSLSFAEKTSENHADLVTHHIGSITVPRTSHNSLPPPLRWKAPPSRDKRCYHREHRGTLSSHVPRSGRYTCPPAMLRLLPSYAEMCTGFWRLRMLVLIILPLIVSSEAKVKVGVGDWGCCEDTGRLFGIWSMIIVLVIAWWCHELFWLSVALVGKLGFCHL